MRQVSRSHPWLAITVAVTVTVAIAALIVAPILSMLARLSALSAPTYTASETTAAQRQLFDTYKLVACVVEVVSGGNDGTLARIEDINGAIVPNPAAPNPALEADNRNAARVLAMAYGTVAAMGSSVVASDGDYQAAPGDVTAEDAAKKKVCGVA